MSLTFAPPEEWEDEERMGYLFAPFPPDHILSENDDKLCFWRKLILSSSKQLNKVSFTLSEMKARLARKGLTPACLAKVLNHLEATRVVQKFENWSSSPASSWSDWGKQLLLQGVSYAWQQVVGIAEDDQTKYIIVDQIKEVAKSVLCTHYDTVQYETTDNLLNEAEFEALCNTHAASLRYIEISLVQVGKLQISTRHNDKKIYKFARRNSTKKEKEISSTDEGILRLKEVTAKLLQQVSDLTEKSERAMDKCRELVAAKQKSSARRWLRQSKMFSKQVETKEAMLTNLQALLTKIQMAETDALVLEAYQAGIISLKDMTIDIEKVDQTMDELEEVLANSNEAGEALSEDVVGRINDDIDVSALEEELAALMLQDSEPTVQQPQQGNTEQETDVNALLPDVPIGNLSPQNLTNREPPTALIS